MSLFFPSVSFGTCVIAFNLALVAAEWALLRGRIRFWAILLQAFLTCIFGSCVDLSMLALTGLDPVSYAARAPCGWPWARCSSAWGLPHHPRQCGGASL